MNWIKHIFLCIGCAALLGGMTACSLQSRIRKADRHYAIGEYYEAAKQYKQIYPKLDSKANKAQKAALAFRQGECYRVLNSASAITCYKNAVKLKYQDSIVYLRLAQCQQYAGKYTDAAKNYTIYLQNAPGSYVAQAGKYACEQVKTWQQTPTRLKVTPAKEFNRKRSGNFAPVFIGDDADAVMFTSNRPVSKKKTTLRTSPVTGKQTFNLFSARKDANGKWTDINPAQGLFGTGEEEGAGEEQQQSDSTQTAQKAGTLEIGVCSFTADGTTMFFTASQPVNGQDLGTQIYVSARAGGEWGEPQQIKLFQDSSISVGHPAINATGDTLYFVSDAPGGYGGKDLYRAVGENTTWGDVQNLGPQINTADDELFPNVRKDGTLYFSSKGHPGYGGLDIFRAVPVGRDTTYGANKLPVYSLINMGMPFNSREDDFGITFEGTTENGFFSSNRDQKKSKNDRIFRFVMPELVLTVEGTLQDEQGEPLSDGVLRLVGTDGTNQKVPVRRDGTYKMRLQPDAKYVMLATSRGYLNQKQEVTTAGISDSRTYKQDFVLTSVSKPVKMNNVFYEFGKWELTEASSQELMGLVKLLKDNPNITIELSAHTDMVGDSVSNLVLSEKRAQSCVDFLISNGIEAARLTPVGYGENMPVVATEAMHREYSFIPEEQVLDEAFISSLTKEQQEICNQINRRTEFKVLKTTYNLY